MLSSSQLSSLRDGWILFPGHLQNNPQHVNSSRRTQLPICVLVAPQTSRLANEDKATTVEELSRTFSSNFLQWSNDRLNKNLEFTHGVAKEASRDDDWRKFPKVGSLVDYSKQHECRIDRGRIQTIPQDSSDHFQARDLNCLRVVESDSSFGSCLSGAFSVYCEKGQLHEVLQTLGSMDRQGMCLSAYTFLSLLQRCIKEKDLAAGREVHQLIVESELESNAYLGNCLIRMFTEAESLSEANEVFRKLSNPNVFSWNAIITAHIKLGCNEQAIKLYYEMHKAGVDPNGHVYVAVLKACSNMAALENGRQIHTHIIDGDFESEVFVGSILIDMYANCCKLDEALRVFNRMCKRNVVTWSSLITGYAQHGHAKEALQLFNQMREEGIRPNEVTFASLLKAYSGVATQEQGKWIHVQIIESGLELDQFIGSTLVDLYAKCGNFEYAQSVFERLPQRDVVTWSALIASYAKQGHGQKALQLFQQMAQNNLVPDSVTFICILQSCASIAALEQGKLIHIQIIEKGLESDLRIGSTLIDMYAKCGSLVDACMLFDRLPKRNVVTWTAMIAGCAQYNSYTLALRYFENMRQVGLRPSEVTYLCLLSACSRAGMAVEGCRQFKSMREDDGLAPTIKHFNAMSELLGRVGCLKEAEDLLESLPFQPDIVGWTSLLGACSTYRYVDLGRRCFDHILLGGGCATAYVLMADIYAHAGMREDAEKITELRRTANVWKKPAKAFIESDNQVHAFTVGDSSHPLTDEIYAKLNALSLQIKEEGYKPHWDPGLESKLDDEKEGASFVHCERLAIAFGLVSEPRGTTIRVAKNLRVCCDCHDAAKIISKIEMREIIISDTYSVHHFKDGACCCNDW